MTTQLSDARPARRATASRPERTRSTRPRAFWALVGCHFVSRTGGFVFPFLVLYLTQARQLSPTTAGAVAAALGAGTIGSLLLGGWLTDRIGRRHTMLAGFVGTAVGLVALGSADAMPTIWVAAVGVGLASELYRPAGSAIVADLFGPRDRVRAYGVFFWAGRLGFSLSTLAAGILVQYGYGLLFWLSAATSLGAALLAWRHIPDTRPTTPATTTRRALLPVLRRDRLMVTLAVVFVVHFALYVQAFSTLPLLLAADGFGPAAYGAALTGSGIVVLVGQPLAVRLLADRDPAAVLGGSMLLTGLGFGLGAVVHSGAGYAAAILVWTLGEIGIAVRFGATFADVAPADLRGGYLGVAAATAGVGSVLGPLLGTALLDTAGRSALGTACAATGLGLLAALLALAPALRRRTSPVNTVEGRS